jgi:hypothetical protein
MTDLITSVLQQAQKKGRLGRVDVLLRYLRMKYKLVVSGHTLERRIRRIKPTN